MLDGCSRIDNLISSVDICNDLGTVNKLCGERTRKLTRIFISIQKRFITLQTNYVAKVQGSLQGFLIQYKNVL